MKPMTEAQVYERIMDLVNSNDAQSVSGLFAFLTAKRLSSGEAFSRNLVKTVFDEVGKAMNAKPTARDELDLQDLYDRILPHLDQLSGLAMLDQYAAIFRMIYEH